MKKIILVFSIMAAMVLTCACGNIKTFGSTEFNKAYIKWLNGNVEEVEIVSWAPETDEYTITTADGRVIRTSKENIILVEGEK